MKTFDKLYARDSSGGIKEWQVKVNKDENYGVIYLQYGKLNGKLILDETIVKKGKNIGRANETTPYEQAIKEATSKWDKQKKKGYKSLKDLGLVEITSMDEQGIEEVPVRDDDNELYPILDEYLPKTNTDAKGNLKPMKAQKFKFNKMKYPVYIQPKINGVRAFVKWGTIIEGEGIFKTESKGVIITSKEGSRYYLPKIEKYFKYLYDTKDCKDIVFDGELYIHGESLNNIKASIPMETKSGKISTPTGDPDKVQFWCFDLAIDLPQDDRRDKLYSLTLESLPTRNFISKLLTDPDYEDKNIEKHSLVCVPYGITHNDEQTKLISEAWIKAGFEGSVLRDRKASYKFGSRPMTMMKFKKFHDTECEIIDIIDKGRKGGKFNIVFLLKNDINNETFECTPGDSGEWTEAQKAIVLADKENVIGKKATVKFYERSGVKEVPFHSNVVVIRDYE